MSDVKRPLSVPSLVGLRSPQVAREPVSECVVCDGRVLPYADGAVSFYCETCGVAYAVLPGLRCECGEHIATRADWLAQPVRETTESELDEQTEVEAEFVVRHRRPPAECTLAEDE